MLDINQLFWLFVLSEMFLFILLDDTLYTIRICSIAKAYSKAILAGHDITLTNLKKIIREAAKSEKQ